MAGYVDVSISNQSPATATAQSPINSSGSTITSGDFLIGSTKQQIPTWAWIAAAGIGGLFVLSKLKK